MFFSIMHTVNPEPFYMLITLGAKKNLVTLSQVFQLNLNFQAEQEHTKCVKYS